MLLVLLRERIRQLDDLVPDTSKAIASFSLINKKKKKHPHPLRWTHKTTTIIIISVFVINIDDNAGQQQGLSGVPFLQYTSLVLSATELKDQRSTVCIHRPT
jgi:hypothetical protein